ncbi:MAG: hypothetical protein HOP13_09260 [Alphaproteobacteria bacterium]|nr:hypothetical protein [Alphaproteobacteria bacterium]
MSPFWRTWLIVWATSVIVFGFVIAGGAFDATSSPIRLIYESLQGPAPFTFDAPTRFSQGVLGAVTIGWGVTVLLMLPAVIDLGEKGRTFWIAIAAGLAAWFVIDSALSIATGFGLNVIANTALAVGFLIPMLATGTLKRSAA